MQTLGSTLSNMANRGNSTPVAFNWETTNPLEKSRLNIDCSGLAIRIARFLYLWQYNLGSPSGLPFIQDTEQWLSTAYRLYKHQLQKQVKPQQTPIAQQTNRVRYTVYGTQYPVSTIRYMVLSPAAHRGKSSTTAKKWREIKGLEWLWSSLQIHP